MCVRKEASWWRGRNNVHPTVPDTSPDTVLLPGGGSAGVGCHSQEAREHHAAVNHAQPVVPATPKACA